jgi:hypothetical protein
MPNPARDDTTILELPDALDMIEARAEYVRDRLVSALSEQDAILSDLRKLRGGRKCTVSWSPGVGYFSDEDYEDAQKHGCSPGVGPTE